MAQGYTSNMVLDTDTTLAANSNYVAPSEKAVKTYIDNHAVTTDVTITGSGTVASPLSIAVMTGNLLARIWMG